MTYFNLSTVSLYEYTVFVNVWESFPWLTRTRWNFWLAHLVELQFWFSDVLCQFQRCQDTSCFKFCLTHDWWGSTYFHVHSKLVFILCELSLISPVRFPPLCYVMFPCWLVDVNVIWMKSFCLFPGWAQFWSYCGKCLLTSLKNIFNLVFYNFIHVYKGFWSYSPFVNPS